jgi:hypothetical protein
MKQIPINNYLIVAKWCDSEYYIKNGHLYAGGSSIRFTLPPEHQWQIVQPTEEVVRGIVKRMGERFMSYSRPGEMEVASLGHKYPYYTALESYHSLLKTNQIENHVLLNKIK